MTLSNPFDRSTRCANCDHWVGSWIHVSTENGKAVVVCSSLCLLLYLKKMTGKSVVKADDLLSS